MRKHGDGGWPAMDGTLLDLLGHHERLHIILRHRNRSRILSMGLCVAFTFHCGGQSTDIVRAALKDRTGLWYLGCMGRRQHCLLPVVLLVSE